MREKRVQKLWAFIWRFMVLVCILPICAVIIMVPLSVIFNDVSFIANFQDSFFTITIYLSLIAILISYMCAFKRDPEKIPDRSWNSARYTFFLFVVFGLFLLISYVLNLYSSAISGFKVFIFVLSIIPTFLFITGSISIAAIIFLWLDGAYKKDIKYHAIFLATIVALGVFLTAIYFMTSSTGL